jgi:predicted RNA-binding Zn ribbon-like protein
VLVPSVSVETEGGATGAPLLGEPLPVELMNTIWADRDGVHDALDDPQAALAWLRAVHPRFAQSPSSVNTWLRAARPEAAGKTARDLRRLRDALRRLAALVTGDPRTSAASAIEDRDGALASVNHACSHATTWSELQWPAGQQAHRVTHTTGPAGRAVVAMLAELGVELFIGDDHHRLRACLAPGCVLYFIGRHPRREWCSSSCGNRARVARHYRRHRPPADPHEV